MKVGILGGGQLGRMLALAGYPLDLTFRLFDPAPDATAGQVAPLIDGTYDDASALQRFADGVDVITYEWENVPVATATALQAYAAVYPPPQALEVAQDRFDEKSFFRSLGIPTPPFVAVDDLASLQAALASLGYPAVLKTRRMGYDGKGQQVLRTPSDVDRAWAALGGTPLILEGFVPFDRELSILAVRSSNGETTTYPLVENHHAEGILRLSLAPAPGDVTALQAMAEDYAQRVLQALEYVGVLAIELFQVGDRLIVNEMAPRVHNSGHWTIEGAMTSQFANHLRAILGLPLGSTATPAPCAMLNLIGTLPDTRAILEVPGAALHLYGKSPRPGRKIGHVTLRGEDSASFEERLTRLQDLIRNA